jgi:hypothetical protein
MAERVFRDADRGHQSNPRLAGAKCRQDIAHRAIIHLFSLGGSTV